MATLGHFVSQKSFESVALDFLLLPSDKSSPKEKVSESILAFLQKQKPKTKTKNTGFTFDIYIFQLGILSGSFSVGCLQAHLQQFFSTGNVFYGLGC